tara:strand:- start:371 stop:1312 length:942 start_codon:yes stop_codon:yes gene_type:complete
MKFKNLSKEDKDFIISTFKRDVNKDEAQRICADAFDVSTRSIRNWMVKLDIPTRNVENIKADAKIMVYDIETSRTTAKVWWTGKQYINHKSLKSEPAIISISYKWLGEDVIHALTWDENHCDKKLMQDFLEEYNSADMVIGQNNDRFDNRWLNARAMKHNLDINVHIKSFDIMKQTKRLFRLPSYSMDYITKYLNVENKLTHEGLHMWDMIEDGNKSQQKEYLQKMVDYNVGDIVSTEAMYVRLRKYMGHKTHIGVIAGKPKWTSPSDGTFNVTLDRAIVTAAGTVQYIMKSNTDGVTYKISNSVYQQYLDSL